MGVIKCQKCSRIVSDKIAVCPKCGNVLKSAEKSTIAPVAPEHEASAPVASIPSKSAVENPAAPSTTKRWMVRVLSAVFALALIIGGALIIITRGDKGDDKPAHSYAPWPDLSEHYDLNKVDEIANGICHFNSYELCNGLVPFSSDRLDDAEYSAKILGTGVWVRSYPTLKNRTKRCQVQTGDVVRVLRSVGYMNGKYWSYVYVMSGRNAGKEGYICSDYIIEQERYDLIYRYIFAGSSNMNVQTPNKYLNAIGQVLQKLDVQNRNPNLVVTMLDVATYSHHTIVTYQIHDLHVVVNSSLLAVVQFFNANNDSVVLGIVPGNGVSRVDQNPNGSYDVYYNR